MKYMAYFLLGKNTYRLKSYEFVTNLLFFLSYVVGCNLKITHLTQGGTERINV